MKANPQQAKILKEKLKVPANLFYLIPKSEVKRLIKQDESTSIANSCESQAAQFCGNLRPDYLADEVLMSCHQQQSPITLNSFTRFPNQSMQMENKLQQGKFGTIYKHPNSQLAEYYCLTENPLSVESYGSYSSTINCSEMPLPVHNLITRNMPDNISEASDTSLDEFPAAKHELYSFNLKQPCNSSCFHPKTTYKQTSSNESQITTLHDPVVANAGKTPQAQNEDKSSTIRINGNECQVFLGIYGRSDNAKSSINIESSDVADGSIKLYPQVPVTCKRKPSLDVQTIHKLDDTSEQNFITEIIPDNISEGFSNSSLHEFTALQHELHPMNQELPRSYQCFELKNIPEGTSSSESKVVNLVDPVVVDASETPQACKSERSNIIGINNGLKTDLGRYNGIDNQKSFTNVEPNDSANESIKLSPQVEGTCEEMPLFEVHTAQQTGHTVGDGQSSNILKRRHEEEKSECRAENSEGNEGNSLCSKDPGTLLRKQKSLHDRSLANLAISCTISESIKKQKLSEYSKNKSFSTMCCLTTNSFLKESDPLNSTEIVDTAVSSREAVDMCHKTASIPVSKDIIEIVTKKRRAYGFDFTTIPEETLIALSGFRKFWSKHLVPERSTAHLSSSTLCKVLNRITQYFSYLSTILKKKPLLEDCENISNIMSFIKYLIKEKGVSHGTAALIVQALLYVVKYRNKSHFADDFQKVESVKKIRNLQAGLLRLYEPGKKMADPVNKKSKLKLMWTEILDVVRKLVSAWEDFSGGKVQKARLIHDLLLILFLVTVSPNRNLDHMRLEIKDLRAKKNREEDEFDHNNAESNYLVLLNDGRILLKDYVFKTSSTYGSSCLELQDIEYLVEYLLLYIDKFRSKLLLSKQHQYLFMKASGDPFLTSSEFSIYLGSAFEKYGSKHITCNDIRKALVTFVLDQQSTTPELKKSLASLMKQGIKYQENVYYQHNFSSDKLEALNFLSKHTGKYLGLSNESEDLATGKEEDEPFDNEETNPEVGSIVALVSEASTWKSPEIFLAKLLQYTDKGRKAVLGEMQLVEGTSHFYHLRPGYSWTENVEALVWPVDVEFRNKEQNYMLKTPLRELHCIVKP